METLASGPLAAPSSWRRYRLAGSAAAALVLASLVVPADAIAQPVSPSDPALRGAPVAAADLSPDLVRRVQQALAREGYRIDAADGRWGPQTATALRAYQRDRGLVQSGRPDPETLTRLGLVTGGSRLPAPATREAPPIRVRTPAADLDAVTIRALQQALAKSGFRTGPADGIWGEQTASGIGNFQRSRGMAASGVPDAATLAALGMLPGGDTRRERRADGLPLRAADLDPAAVRMMQQALNDRGYAVGTADGTWGERTTTAMRDFQRSQGIEPTGEPDIYTLVALDIVPSGRSRR